jgi:hypothetical protein
MNKEAKKSNPNKTKMIAAQQKERIRNKTEWTGFVDIKTKKPKLNNKKLILKCK